MSVIHVLKDISMSVLKTIFCAAVASLSLAACSSLDTMDPSQRNTAIGGKPGHYTSCQEQGGCYAGGRHVAARSDLACDQTAHRYYYIDYVDPRRGGEMAGCG